MNEEIGRAEMPNGEALPIEAAQEAEERRLIALIDRIIWDLPPRSFRKVADLAAAGERHEPFMYDLYWNKTEDFGVLPSELFRLVQDACKRRGAEIERRKATPSNLKAKRRRHAELLTLDQPHDADRVPVPHTPLVDGQTWTPLIDGKAFLDSESVGAIDRLIWSLPPRTFRKTHDLAERGIIYEAIRPKLESALIDWLHGTWQRATGEETLRLYCHEIDILHVADRDGLLVFYIASACHRRDGEIRGKSMKLPNYTCKPGWLETPQGKRDFYKHRREVKRIRERYIRRSARKLEAERQEARRVAAQSPTEN